MTFVASPQPLNVPPRVRLDIDSDDPAAAFTSLSVKRDGALIREQPFVGGPEALAFDYEAPFGVPVTYTVEGEFSTYSSVYTTAWPNLTGWTTGLGTPSVAGGYLKGAGPAAQVFRAVAATPVGRLTLSAPLRFSGGTTGSAEVGLGSAGSGGITISMSDAGGGLYYLTFGAGPAVVVPIVHTSGVLTATWDADGVAVTTPQGSWSAAGTWIPVAHNLIASVLGFGQVPGFTLETFAGNTPFSDSDTTQLDVDEAWLIHPSQPSLSVSVDPGAGKWRDEGINVDLGTKPNLSRKSTATRFNNVGRSKAVLKTHGNRMDGEWTLVLFTPRLEDRDAVQAIITDETPLLFRAPQDWDWDLPDGWYGIGDVDEARSFQGAGLQNPYRNITLPLTPVDEPIVRLGALWTWGDVLLTNDTWQDVLDNYDTWLDLLAGPSS